MIKAEFSLLVAEEEAKMIQSMREIWRITPGLKMVTSNVGALGNRERFLAKGQQWNGDFSTTSIRNWILPTAWMNLEVDFSWVSSQGLSPADILITTLRYSEQRNHTRLSTYKLC